MEKKEIRLRRARKTRARIAALDMVRLTIHRTNQHIYAQVIDATGGRVLASASTLEVEVRNDVKNGGNTAAAALVGKRIAEKEKAAGVERVAFDRAGFK
ncbi:MAG: 50S ribosomal protein L18, partial [Burkholderiales bacterium]